MKKLSLNQAGDTIIEVMISVAIVGLAIGLAYGTASRSLRGMRQSQERGEALKQVEGQIERLKSTVHNDRQGLFNTPQIYCLADTPATKNKKISPFPSSRTAIGDLNDDPLGTAYPNECKDGLYHVAIQPGGSPGDQFTVVARWFSLGSSAKEEVKIIYRIHPSND